jgi:succinate dehydrogenase/fumarate reductase flavoprotein subunit
MEQYEGVETDVLIIGGGAAGVRAAIEAADQGCNVILTNKGLISKSGATPMADTFAIPLHPLDSKKAHFEDIVRVGRDLGDQNLIQALVDDAKARLHHCLSDVFMAVLKEIVLKHTENAILRDSQTVRNKTCRRVWIRLL